ncbi:hypothetical protein LX32DRAFT_722382 [Colletotrichum zoysiae]|uniref:Protein NO VEIN C-terminal domain-containing protein n=1 Tax=Colletotrichum zoysiae TaxID=1216348 RepID=A0AAD9M6X1_9PEZI|nr:hypothetical protein LX32DRAFT_722382 [Colletotrichum zoysiae]
MATSDDRQLAKRQVQQIAEDHGYVSEDTLQYITNPEARRKIENAFLKKDLMGGLSIITLAKNLYSTKARFIFELLQNADDNQYSKAAASGSLPAVSFQVFPHRIVVECNEDGFTRENLTAICAVGQSSKTGAQGYIGEKGIGFKSIFMVAWKAHIQSEAFSFSFRHKKGDSGIGMITPVWEETDEVLESPLTRITLYLDNAENSAAFAETQDAIRTQFDELQETVLLFLKNIRRIDIKFHDDEGRQTTSVTHVCTQPQPDRAKLESIHTTNGHAQKQTRHFHVTRVNATNLAKNDNRTYSETEEAVKAYSVSEVVVAFPLSETSAPIVESQEVFAFLPIGPAGFKFLIQADFVTNANRQDIVKDSVRNVGLRDGVGKAFITAVTQFLAHESLRYQWVQFLPDKQIGSWDKFWLGLIEEIGTLLKSAPVLFDHKGSPNTRTVLELVRLGFGCADEYGDSLFDDGTPGEIISRQYGPIGERILADYGMRMVTFNQLVSWVRADLENATSSRMKSPDTPESWHVRAADLLNSAFVKNFLVITSELTMLDLIPLEDGSWVSAVSGPTYFPQVDGLDIPTDIGLRIVSRRVKNERRILLFKSLGATTAEPRMVREHILQSYKTAIPSNFTIEASKQHLKFLYMSETLAERASPYEAIAIFNHHGKPQRPGQQTIYLTTDNTHGAVEVFKATSPGTNPGDGAIGYKVAFVNKEYFVNEPAAPKGQKMSWRVWFSERLGVKTHIDVRFLGLKNGLFSVLAGESQYIHKNRPDKFMGCVVRWYKTSPSAELGDGEIRCLRTKYALERLYQPWIGHDGESNSIYLDLFRSMMGIQDCTWEILIDELRELKASKCDDSDRIETIYKALDALCGDPSVAQNDQAKAPFENEALIYLPLDGGLSWHKPSQCVWSNTTKLSGRVSLNDEYGDLGVFFVEFLGVKPLDLSMAIDDLKKIATRPSTTSSEIKESIWVVNSLLSSVSTLPSSRDVLKSRIFPIAYPDDRFTVETVAKEFFIVDRESLRSSFETKVKFLDFTLEQVARLRPFIEWTHLEERYLSRRVKEITSFHGGAAALITNPQRQIQNRAHALLRRDTGLSLHSASQIERDCKIGAAGELYVSTCSDIDNWQSNIRRYVTVHPDYASMEPWSGRETSDLVYDDVSGRLTSLLVDKGYLARERWLLRPRGPKYFIEVKTTTMSCETAFYMSKAQYQRMRNNVVTEDSDTLYVIFRVYNVGQENIGVKVYVDPETLRLAGRLQFTGETWSVVPG